MMDSWSEFFHNKDVRRELHDGEWWFAVDDVIAVLTGTPDPQHYLAALRSREREIDCLFHRESRFDLPGEVRSDVSGGKKESRYWNTEGTFRLIQSIPSRPAEPLKRWLAKVGCERALEMSEEEVTHEGREGEENG